IQVKRFLCAQAIMFAMAGVPGIYFHSLFGSRGDRAGAESSGIPRRINRKKLERAELENDLADTNSLRAKVFSRMSDVLKARALESALNPPAPQKILDIDPRVFAIERTAANGETRVLCLHNVSDSPVVTPKTNSIFGDAEKRVVLIGSQKALADENQIELEPYDFLWMRA